MLYKTLLTKVINFVDAAPEDPGSQTVRALSRVTGKNLRGYVEQFDVREIGNLRKIIPMAFPKVLRDVPIVAEQNIHGAWRVVPMALMGRTTLDKYRDNSGGYIL